MTKQWILAKEQLPKETCEVIIKVDGVERVTVALFDNRSNTFFTTNRSPEDWWRHGPSAISTLIKERVTHWMPLPAFPHGSLEGFNIKLLEWQNEENDTYVAFGHFGTFEVYETGGEDGLKPFMGSLNDNNDYDGYEPMDFDTVEKAKAYCEFMHIKMIQAALEFVEVQA